MFTAAQISIAGAISAESQYRAWSDFTESWAEYQRRALLESEHEVDPRTITSRHECTSCGSHEHVRHNGQTVCTYCRSAI